MRGGKLQRDGNGMDVRSDTMALVMAMARVHGSHAAEGGVSCVTVVPLVFPFAFLHVVKLIRLKSSGM